MTLVDAPDGVAYRLDFENLRYVYDLAAVFAFYTYHGSTRALSKGLAGKLGATHGMRRWQWASENCKTSAGILPYKSVHRRTQRYHMLTIDNAVLCCTVQGRLSGRIRPESGVQFRSRRQWDIHPNILDIFAL
jgi:hypothetical protein